ncbi:PREDICTED: hydroxyproline O-galactosyltransferase GALT3 [Nelumbo nucifera]|uniref:Hydroxyproline O-galactosyltransferase GALT3 n=1 Tax=Nelumbo nucifera TaxID=4432 RepID=A0A1U8BIJ4_NELNU|nr:PREDICTED: hydroxyproline O-galactosyltransferase GALT3 [Nelumbo nucifera]XP_010276522.1 PREDICTED: hydroxyproline O-galactosyltransferase GALT3 [Nelumbo nucifera]
MKKWTGGTLIISLAMILILRYSLMQDQPKKQSAYDFFWNHPSNNSRLGHNGVTRTSQLPQERNRARKPYLINVDGLNDLYSLKNISEEDSKVVLVWAQMRSLLSRSDSLSETAQGIKEASVAWKDLLAAIEDEKASRIRNSNIQGNDEKDKNCPFSVGMLNSTMSIYGTILEFPCGLADSSSITLVGIPDGRHGSFQIELIGSLLPGESKPPIVLHYNVSLPGDKMTEDPVIIQNTWTKELGWGKDERCPARGSSSNIKVDGLISCNEQVMGTVLKENLNGSQPSSKTNTSGGSTHITFNFPFVEGNPFTATLWVGPEGFHMTVNGRHETSFAYREKLEPWLVSGVKVGGGLHILSALANGLPVSEDMDLIIDAKQLKAPPVSRKRLTMLIGVFSTGNNFERRMALRRSWMQYKAVRSGDVAVRFFIGLQKNKQVNIELWKESQMYGDIQLMPFVDYYNLITLKTVAICIMGIKILPAKYIMKMDDDAFVRIDEVLSSLKGKVSNGLLYGLISFDSKPHRDRDSKWYISTEEWPHASYPPWAHGPGYIISRDIAKFIVQGHQERDLKLFKLEDVAMGIWIEQFKKSGKEVHYVSDDRFYNAGCESNYILAHYQGPRMVLCLWEKLQLEHEPTCCE